MATPTINQNGVTGDVSTGSTLTIAGTNLQNEDTTNYDPDYDANEFGFEGASPTADGWNDNVSAINTSGASLIGSKSLQWEGLQSGSPGSSFGPGSINRIALSSTPGNVFYRFYTREDMSFGNGTYGDTSHKLCLNYDGNYQINLNYSASATAYTSAVILMAGQTNDGITGNLRKGAHVNNRWYCWELEMPNASPWNFRVWNDGELIIATTGDSNPNVPPNGLQFPVNTQSSDNGYGVQQWYDGWVVSTSRIYPACMVEISDTSDFSGTKVYQSPLFISDTSVQVECDLTGLTGPNYYLRVTNGQNTQSAIYDLSGGGSSSTSRSSTFAYFR